MLTADQRVTIERRLRDERERALEALGQFDEEFSQSLQEEAGELSMYRFHMADIGTEAMQREKHFLLASKEGERLYRIDAALRRLYGDPETFGECARCGSAVAMERLELVPEAELCAECQGREEEGDEGA
jgi:DnaK suppressor protein